MKVKELKELKELKERRCSYTKCNCILTGRKDKKFCSRKHKDTVGKSRKRKLLKLKQKYSEFFKYLIDNKLTLNCYEYEGEYKIEYFDNYLRDQKINKIIKNK